MNPFLHEHSDPWSDELVDVESINAHVSDAVIAHIDAARAQTLGAERPRAALMLVRGPAGSGKTHLFARLRRRCGARAAFVLVRPEIGVEPSMRLLLAKVIEALSRHAFGTQQRQLDVVVGSTLGVLRGQRAFPTATLAELQRSRTEQIDEAIEEVLDQVEQVHPDVSFNYLDQLLRVPFAKSGGRRAAMTWLAGNAPSEAQLRKLGLTAGLADAELMPALRTLALACALQGPLVLVFDQLENLYDSDERPGRINAYGNLVAELYDSVPGLVMVQMALDAEWAQRIRPQLSLPQVSRLEAQSHMLELPLPDQRLELVRAWTEQLPVEERTPFPFDELQLAQWRAQPGLTPRMLLIACRRILAGEKSESGAIVAAPGSTVDDAAEELAERFLRLWGESLDAARLVIRRFQCDESPVPAERIVGGIVCLGRLLGANPTVDKLPVSPTVHLRLEGVGLAVGVFQLRSAGPMGRVLQAAANAAEHEPVLLLREAALAIPSTWKGVEARRVAFEASFRGTWAELGHDELTRLLALHDFEALARSGDLTASDGSVIAEDAALAWLEEQLGWRDWATAACIRECVEGTAAKGEPPRPALPATPAAVPRRSSVAGDLLKVLRRLHLASVDRLAREARGADPALSRAAVIEALAGVEDEVHWLGQSLVCAKEVLP